MSRIKRIASDMARVHADAFSDFWGAVDASASILREIDPIRRKPFMAQVVLELLEAQNGKCAICFRPIEIGRHHVDHRIPFRWGGGHERTNLQIAHPVCNQKRGDAVSPYDLISYLEDRAHNH